jgi:hypothetical protein
MLVDMKLSKPERFTLLNGCVPPAGPILMTVSATTVDDIMANRAGADECLIKP